ncbi:DUF6756 family protein [Mucilaginibacter sp.]|uniref:DUF6756 family protein n=1 Tax=Mucilaginibacter sp. TaxID=1882438 RepID=UPI003D115D45
MGDVKDNFEEAIKTLNLSADIVNRLNNEANQKLYLELLDRFVDGGDRRWWWEAFKTSFRFPDYDYPAEHLIKIIPDLKKKVWIMIEDDQLPFYPIYEIQTLYIPLLIDECFFEFEYYVIDKDMEWLICVNHHNYLIGVGHQLQAYNKNIIISDE